MTTNIPDQEKLESALRKLSAEEKMCRPIQRNALGPAYQLAEDLLDNARSLATALDAYSRDGRSAELNAQALDYLRHNIINANNNLERIYLTLRPLAEAAQARAIIIASSAGDPAE